MIKKPPKKERGRWSQVFDYDSDALYDEIYHLAFNGASDKDIANMLENDHHEHISDDLFSRWKNGKYEKWTKEENERRSSRLVGVLTRARSKVVFGLKNAYLKMALGKVKTKNKGTVKRRMVVNGQQTDDELVQTTENEVEYAPSLQAIQVLLYHYDPDWRKVQKGVEELEDGIPRNIEHGIDVEKWIKKEVTDGNGYGGAD